jgi:hypothetical protein
MCTWIRLTIEISFIAAKKAQLLLVLHHPELPLHNNPAELTERACFTADESLRAVGSDGK